MRRNGNVLFRVLSLIMVLSMVLSMMPNGVFAADDTAKKLYLKPSSNWLQGGARFAMYYFGNGDGWTGMSDADGDGIYEGVVPAGFTSVIFCRMDPNNAENGWGAKWNQTADLAVPADGTNLYTVAEGTWDKGGGEWSVHGVSYGVTYNLTNLTADEINVAVEGADFATTLKAALTYALPETITVSVGGKALTEGYTYDRETGAVVVSAAAVTGEISITAEANMILYLKPSSNWLQGGARFAMYCFGNGETWVGMSDPDGDGLYQAVLPKGYPSVIFCRMDPNNGENGWGAKWNQTADLAVPADGTNLYTVAEGTWDQGGGTWTQFVPKIPEPELTFVVAGSAGLCGVEWDEDAEENKMTRNADGKYEKVYTFVPAGSYECKVTDGTWTNSWGDNGGNVKIQLTDVSNVTVTIDPETKAVTVSVEDPYTYIVAGDQALCGVNWDPAAEANRMTKNAEGKYEIVYTAVPKGQYGLKVTDGTWTNSWGDGTGNFIIKVETPCDVTVTFDPESKTIKATGSGLAGEDAPFAVETVGAVGNGSGNWLGGSAWDPAANVMTETSENVFEITYQQVAAGSYEVKFVADKSWANNWGGVFAGNGQETVGEYNSGNNIAFRVDVASADVTLKLDLTGYDHATKTGAKFTVTWAEHVEVPAVEYYLVGYINGADHNEAEEELKFVDGKLKLTVTADSYVAVKASDADDWYMTAGLLGNVTSATLSQNPAGADKLMIPAGVEYELTLMVNDDGTLTLSYAEVKEAPAKEYYLAGYINGADVNDNQEALKLTGGTLTTTFTQTSYVILRDSDGKSYLAETYCQGTTVVLKEGCGEKMQVPGGIELTFTVVENADGTLTLSYKTAQVETPADADYYLVGYLNGADVADTLAEYKFADGKLSIKFNQDSYVQVKNDQGTLYATQTYCQGTTGTFKAGASEKMFVPGNADLTFNLTINDDGTLTLSYEAVREELSPDYYLVGYINGADYGIGADSGNLGSYKFVDGKLSVVFNQASYVVVKNGNGQTFLCESYCQANSATMKPGWGEKMYVPGNTYVTFNLVINGDGSVTLSYGSSVIVPPVPEGYNKVTIHFLRPDDWGGRINAWVWDADGALPGFEMYQTAWPGSEIPRNGDRPGWYDVVIGTKEPQAFNFIFNDGTKQTADLTTGKVTGPTELWVVGNDVYTEAPKEWTHCTVLVHYQKPENWNNKLTFRAWIDGKETEQADTMTSPNLGWHTAEVDVEIGKSLKVQFSDGTNESAELDAGKITKATELWFNGNGVKVPQPANWIDVHRTIHVAGTFPGPAWDAAGNKMRYDPELGLYTITFKDVQPGKYEYKIAINGAWDENYGEGGVRDGGNITVVVPEKQDVTVWYSDISHRSVCSVSYDVNVQPELSGTGIPEDTKLTDPTLSGIYTANVKLPAGTHGDLKVTYGEHSYTFAEFTTYGERNITFRFDAASYIASHNASGVKVRTAKLFYDTKDLDYKAPYGAVATGEEATFAIDTDTDATQVSLTIKGLEPVVLHKDGEAESGVQRWVCTTTFENLGEYDYYFAVSNDTDTVYYTDDIYNDYYKTGDYGTGTVRDINNIFPYDLIVYQADYTTPDWMKNAVIYQIFPDRFFDGDETNNQAQSDARGSVDYEYVSDWYLLPENPEAEGNAAYPVYAMKGDGQWSNEIYGGDLEGITQRIDYLKALGVTVIYINPVFSSISSHRYDACDYTQIDPILGTLGDFEELVQVAEENGMHVILDGVFNHVSDDSVYFDRYYKFLGTSEKVGAYPYWAYVYDYMAEKSVSVESAEAAARTYFGNTYGITDFSYTEWFAINNETGTAVDHVGLRSGKAVYTYEGWWGFDSMPVIKSTEGSEYQTGTWAEEIIGNAEGTAVSQYWISKGSDGWRLDVANEVSDETWQNFRTSVKAMNSDAVIVGEIWFDAVHYLMGDQYDSVMNYVFRDAVAGFARGYLINRDNKAEKWDADFTAADATAILEILRERYPEEAFYAMMNLVGSHDTARILSYLDDVEDDRHQKDMANTFPTYENTSDRAKNLQYVVSFLQFTYAGAPTVYYGDEIGMVGADDPDDRRAFEWGKGNEELVTWYATLAAIRNQYSALRTGTVDAFAPSRDVMGYVRSDEADTLVVLANRAGIAADLVLSTEELGLAADVTVTDLITGSTYTAVDGKLRVSVAAYRGVILTETVKEITVDKEALAPAFDPAFTVAERSETAPKGTYATEDGLTAYIGSEAAFHVDAVVNTFVGVSVDGKALEDGQYRCHVGTVVTLNADTVETLGEGEHEIVLDFEGGSATAKFTVEQPPVGTQAPTEPENAPAEDPAVENSGNGIIWIGVGCGAAAGGLFAVILALTKKKKA